jgi:hypothetical protein
MEATTAASVKTTTASAASVTAAMLGKSGCRGTNQAGRSDSCEKSVQQGGFPHVITLHPNGGWLPGRANRLF